MLNQSCIVLIHGLGKTTVARQAATEFTVIRQLYFPSFRTTSYKYCMRFFLASNPQNSWCSSTYAVLQVNVSIQARLNASMAGLTESRL